MPSDHGPLPRVSPRAIPILLGGLSVFAACAAPTPDGAGPLLTRITDVPAARDRASTGGVSWADYDGDGDPDLFVTNGYDVSGAEPVPQGNRLYRNDGGRLVPVSDTPLVTDSGFSSGATWGDYDNDGDLDVFVSNQRGQGNFLYRNEGAGRFVRVSGSVVSGDGGSSYSAGWVDVDRDGHLDLFVSNGGLGGAEPNFLYRNAGDGTFTKIVAGPVVTDTAASGGAVWGDYDGDGDADLFVANRLAPGSIANHLYRNDGDWRFTRVTGEPVVTDTLPSLAAAWGDYDNDGDLDLYVANTRGFANTLYENREGSFARVEAGAPTLDGGNSYGASWADADNDGWLDLVVVNWAAAPVVYRNLGNGDFARALPTTVVGHASSLAWGDLDGDGDLDLYTGNWPNRPGTGEPNFLFRNDTPPRSWLRVRLVGVQSNRAAIGARVTVRARIAGRDLLQTRDVTAHTSWRSQDALPAHFGLGNADRVDEVLVRWPSGTVDRLTDVSTGREITVREGTGRVP